MTTKEEEAFNKALKQYQDEGVIQGNDDIIFLLGWQRAMNYIKLSTPPKDDVERDVLIRFRNWWYNQTIDPIMDSDLDDYFNGRIERGNHDT